MASLFAPISLRETFKPLPAPASEGVPANFDIALIVHTQAITIGTTISAASLPGLKTLVSSVERMYTQAYASIDMRSGILTSAAPIGMNELVSFAQPLPAPGDETHGADRVVRLEHLFNPNATGSDGANPGWTLAGGDSNTTWDLRLVAARSTYGQEVNIITGARTPMVLIPYTVEANGGNDTYIAGAAQVRFDGGAGVDRADYMGLDPGSSLQISAGAAAGSYTVQKNLKDQAAVVDSIFYLLWNGRYLSVRGTDIHTWGNRAVSDQLVGTERIRGTRASDHFIGGAAQDVFEGGGGNDLFYGGDGNDVYIAGAGNDRFEGGNGSDTADFSLLNARILVQQGLPSVGLVTTSFGSSATRIYETLVTKSGGFSGMLDSVENIIGTAFNDDIQGNGAANYFVGGAGQDSLSGAGGNDTLEGGAGNDFLSAGDGNDRLQGDDGNDELWDIDATGNDTLLGGAGDDQIWASGGTNMIDAGPGNNRVECRIGFPDAVNQVMAGAGNSTLIGGSGIDTFLLDTSPGTTIVASITGQKTDHLVFNVSNPAMLHFVAHPESLEIRVLGAAKTVTVTGWFHTPAAPPARFDSIEVGSLRLDKADLDHLMAVQSSLAPPTGDAGAPVLAAYIETAWQQTSSFWH